MKKKLNKKKSKIKRFLEIVDSPAFGVGFLAAMGLFMGIWLFFSLLAKFISILDKYFFEIVLPIYFIFFIFVHYYLKDEKLDKDNFINLGFISTSLFLFLLFLIGLVLS